MIKYSLNCKECDLKFESWFASSKEYEKLKRIFNFWLSCVDCVSIVDAAHETVPFRSPLSQLRSVWSLL